MTDTIKKSPTAEKRTVSEGSYDAERAFYGEKGLHLSGCRFEGPADGESAVKECRDIEVSDCYFALRYPFWHVDGLRISASKLTPSCRAALWYSNDIEIYSSKLIGIKALRECRGVRIEGSTVCSAEFGWSTTDAELKDSTVEGEYMFLRAERMKLSDVKQKGKYSFQYVKDVMLENCELDTKDAFWHAENVTLKGCRVKGEYLAWYSKSLTLIDCEIEGTQPFCYCRELKLINCTMLGTDLAFERSDVEATLASGVLSIKNPYSGSITLPSVGEIIIDDENARAEINITEKI